MVKTYNFAWKSPSHSFLGISKYGWKRFLFLKTGVLPPERIGSLESEDTGLASCNTEVSFSVLCSLFCLLKKI